MLLVGVMPLSAVQTSALQSFRVYFAQAMGSGAWTFEPFVHWWYQDSNNNNDYVDNHSTVRMSYVSGSKEATGYWIHYYDVSLDTSGNYGITFISDSSDSPAWTTDSITGNDLQNGYLYYLTDNGHGTDNKYFSFNAMPYTDVSTCKVLASNEFSANVNNDMNVVIDDAGTSAFQKNPERHYVSATLFDYFSDYELKNGTTRTGKNGNTTVNSGITNMYRTWEDPLRRMPMLTFDKALSNYYLSYSGTYQHPLYFGDIHHENNGYKFGNNVANNSYSGFNNNDGNGTERQDGFNEGNNWQLVYGSSYKQLYHDNNSLRRNVLADYEKAIPNVATTGLYATNIGDYDATKTNVYNAKRLKLSGSGTTGGAAAKWFDSDWLTSSNSTGQMIGASYDVDFPFWTEKVQRKINGTTWAECTYFHIDSEEKKHALRMHKGTNNKYYLKETNEGIYNYTGNDYDILHKGSTDALTSTYGFFPFNDKSDFYNGDWGYSNKSQDVNGDLQNIMDPPLRLDRTNYGFGTYMVIPFKLNDKGTLYGTDNPSIDAPITFTFSGDDDLLVYVDGKLVLDIGGNHGKVQGEINFHEKKSWVSRVKSNDNPKEYDNSSSPPKEIRSYNSDGVYNGEGEKFFGYFSSRATLSGDSTNKLKNFDSSTNDTSFDGVTDLPDSVCTAGQHVMEIFYVERGLFDSNMEIMYNLPVKEDRSFTVEEHIDTTTGVNDVFKNDNTFSTNASNLKLQIDVQFSEPTNGNDFTQLLGNQEYHGDHPNKYTLTSALYQNDFVSSGSAYTAKIGNSQTLTYVNDFIKPYDYNLKVSQNNSKIFIGDNNTGKTVSSLFNTSWTLAKYGSNTDENTGQGDGAGPVHTTSSSSRPTRGTKTTSTSAGNSFDFHGTVENPDAIAFYNTMQTADLTINKTITARKPSDASTNPLKFTVKVTFDDVGGIALEDGRDANGAIITPRYIEKEYEISVDNTNSGSITIKNIPVNTKYKIEETGNNSYTASYSDTVNTNWQTLTSSSGGEATVTNNYQQESPGSVAITLQIQKRWADSTDMPEKSAVKFQLQRKVGSGDFEPFEVSGITDSDGIFNMTGASDYPNEGQIVIWTLEISGASITNINSNGDDITYRILEYKENGTDLILQDATDDNKKYNDNWIANYTFALDPETIATQNEKLGNAKDANDQLLLAVLNTHPTSNPTNPETGGNGIYIVIIGGFIAILLAGAGYFIYKKRLLV